MGFLNFLRRGLTSAAGFFLALLVVAVLFTQFWGLQFDTLMSGVVEDIHDYARPSARTDFAQDVYTMTCGKVSTSDSQIEDEEDRATREQFALIINYCSKNETRLKLDQECLWAKENSRAVRFSRGNWTFETVAQLRDACAKRDAGELDDACEELGLEEGSETTGGLPGFIVEVCPAYEEGEVSDQELSKEFLSAALTAVGGTDRSLESIPEGIIPHDEAGLPLGSAPMLRVTDFLLSMSGKDYDMRGQLIFAIFLLVVFMLAINIKHEKDALRAITRTLIAPTLLLLLTYAGIKLYVGIFPIDTTFFLEALTSLQVGGDVFSGLISEILPLIFLRFFTPTLLGASVAFLFLGIGIYLTGNALVSVVERHWYKKSQEVDDEDDDNAESKSPSPKKKDEEEKPPAVYAPEGHKDRKQLGAEEAERKKGILGRLRSKRKHARKKSSAKKGKDAKPAEKPAQEKKRDSEEKIEPPQDK